MSWQNTLVYRFSFLLWRLESIILFLSSYLFWLAVYNENLQISGYTKPLMLTYIIGVLILRNFVFSNKISQVGAEISDGSLNKYLIQPIEYFRLTLAQDLGDRASNTFLLILELLIIYFLFKPPFFFQTSVIHLILFFFSIIGGVFIYFYLSFLVAITTFWWPEHAGWPQRFLFDTIIIFLTGGWFPLDILPKPIFNFLQFLPSTYLRFFPLQIYLGKVALNSILPGFIIMSLWVILLGFLVKRVWQKGLKSYSAVGI